MSDDAQISSERTRKCAPPPFCLGPNRHRAFTIIELLVVLAIIAVLAAIILPIWNRGCKGGSNVPCMSNLRQIGISMMMYSSDHNIYPSALGGGPVKTW